MLNPFTIWARMMDATLELSRAGQKVSETLIASQQVVATRSDMIRTAVESPLDADYAELARMIPEKVEAFSKAGWVMANGWWAMQADVMAQTQRLMAAASRKRPPTPADLQATTARNIVHGFRVIERSMALSAEALKPIHARATSNARRLKRTRKS